MKAVDTHNPAALALLERIVDINSGTMNVAGVRRVGDVLRAQFDSLGFETHWVDGTAFHRAGHLVAEHRGPGPKILLIGHLDTVFEPSSPFQRFERLNDSTARGPGVIDMKGGDVIMLYALRAIADAGALDKMNIVAVFDGDEEEAGTPLEAARRALVDAARGARAAIGFEDGAADPRTAVISRRSAGSWTVRTSGQPAHSSQIFKPTVGAGAVYEAARIVHEFYTSLSGEQYLTFNPGLAAGGTLVNVDTTGTEANVSGKRNVVAEHMVVTGDLRTLSPAQESRARKTMQQIVARHLPLTSATIEFDDGYPPMAPTAGNRRLLATYDRASRDLGYGPVSAVDPSRAGAADVSFVAGKVPMIIDGVGLSGHDDHTEKETADLRMLAPLTKRAALLMYRITETAGAAVHP
ncbi:MAG TPA: M20/M25/M40 family metallo-hydrolase [Gemmatimonadaceae bacterium]|nr:M20/M25/M40 family metallo-hydrolase [Gemmatimonadaceae bacterium]